MAQSGEGKRRVFIVGRSQAALGGSSAAQALLRCQVMTPMGSAPSSFGVLLGIGSTPFESTSFGEGS